MNEITRFILFIGPCSSIFDYTTYLVMLYVFKAWDPSQAHLFQTGWFVESLLTQTLIIHVIRTNKIRSCKAGPVGRSPSPRSWSWLSASTFPSRLCQRAGLRALPRLYWLFLLMTLACYMVLTQVVKAWLLKKAWA